jgi:hypothetical protein
VLAIGLVQGVDETLIAVWRRALRERAYPTVVEPPLHDGSNMLYLSERGEPSVSDDSKVGQVSEQALSYINGELIGEMADLIIAQGLQCRI